MRDTRRARIAIAIALTAGISAVLGEMYLRPILERTLR